MCVCVPLMWQRSFLHANQFNNELFFLLVVAILLVVELCVSLLMKMKHANLFALQIRFVSKRAREKMRKKKKYYKTTATVQNRSIVMKGKIDIRKTQTNRKTFNIQLNQINWLKQMTSRNDEANILCKVLQLFTLENWTLFIVTIQHEQQNGRSGESEKQSEQK